MHGRLSFIHTTCSQRRAAPTHPQAVRHQHHPRPIIHPPTAPTLACHQKKKKKAPTQRGSPSRRGRARCPPPAPSFPGHLRPPPQQTVGSLPPWMVAGRRSSSAHLMTPPLPGSARSRVVVIFPAHNPTPGHAHFLGAARLGLAPLRCFRGVIFDKDNTLMPLCSRRHVRPVPHGVLVRRRRHLQQLHRFGCSHEPFDWGKCYMLM